MQEKRNDLKMELLSKRKLEFKSLENSQTIHIAEKWDSMFRENIKGMAKWAFDKEISMSVNQNQWH